MTQEELYNILSIDESYRIERTISTNNMDKFQEAICAFANDLPRSRKKVKWGKVMVNRHLMFKINLISRWAKLVYK